MGDSIKIAAPWVIAAVGWFGAIASGVYYGGIVRAEVAASTVKGDDHEARIRLLERQNAERLTAIEQRIIDIARTLDRMDKR